MATRNILHISKLQEFEDFLETKGYMIVATSKNPFEVLRAQKDGDRLLSIRRKTQKNICLQWTKIITLCGSLLRDRECRPTPTELEA